MSDEVKGVTGFESPLLRAPAHTSDPLVEETQNLLRAMWRGALVQVEEITNTINGVMHTREAQRGGWIPGLQAARAVLVRRYGAIRKELRKAGEEPPVPSWEKRLAPIKKEETPQ